MGTFPLAKDQGQVNTIYKRFVYQVKVCQNVYIKTKTFTFLFESHIGVFQIFNNLTKWRKL